MSDISTTEQKRNHIRTLKDVFAIFEPYLDEKDCLEILEELKGMRGERDDSV